MSTSVSPPAADPVFTAKRDRRVRRWVAAGATVLLSLVLFIIVRTQGFVSGREFCPSDFRVRKFSFYEIPLLHLQITPITRDGTTIPTSTYLRQKNLITRAFGKPVQWHLVSLSRGLTGTTPADAELLVAQLRLRAAGSDYWRQWSLDHPAQAKVLWPIIQRLADRELYILMPELFELAQLDQTPSQLQQRVDVRLRDQYLSLIGDMQAAGRTDLAGVLIEEAKNDYPDDEEFKKLSLDLSTLP